MESSPSITPLMLLPHQVDHVNLIQARLGRRGFVIDTSAYGGGKTITAIYTALHGSFNHLIVIHPMNIAGNWADETARYGVKLDYSIHNEALTGKKLNTNPGHGLLTRRDIVTKRVVSKADPATTSDSRKVQYEPSEKLRNLVRNRALLVIDEFHNAKNDDTNFNHAVTAMVGAFLDYPNAGSKVMFLSGTPANAEKHCITMMKVLRIIVQPKTHEIISANQELTLLGAEDVVRYASNINFEATSSFLRTTPFDRFNVKHLLYRLYAEIIFPEIKVTMPTVVPRSNIYTGLFRLSEADEKVHTEALEELARVVRFNPQTGAIDGTRAKGASIGRPLKHGEFSKLNLLIAVIIRDLESDPMCKVGVAVNNCITAETLYTALAQYNPGLIVGRIKAPQRKDAIAKFQEDNNDCRLLIVMTSIVNSGGNFSDMHGNRPRRVYIVPNFNAIPMHQFTGRWMRIVSKSVPTIIFVFIRNMSAQENMEIRISRALMRSDAVFKDLLPEQHKDGVKFFGDYETYEHPEDLPVAEGPYNIAELLAEDDVSKEEIEDITDQIENLTVEAPPTPTPKFDLTRRVIAPPSNRSTKSSPRIKAVVKPSGY